MLLFVPCGCSINTLASAIPAHDQQIRKMPNIFFSRNRIMPQTKKPAPRLRPVALGNRMRFSGVADGRPKPFASDVTDYCFGEERPSTGTGWKGTYNLEGY
jgi:hypothetical protein